MKQEWSSPCGFCAVPVLPATSMPSMRASFPVPFCASTTPTIACRRSLTVLSL